MGEEAWKWIKYIVSSQLLVEGSELRTSNYLPGWLHVRMQQVKAASHDQCLYKDDAAGVECVARTYDQDTANRADLLDVKAYWETVNGQAGRDPNANPGEFATADEAESKWAFTSHDALYGYYDASGYTVNYYLQNAPLSDTYDAYLNDMDALKDDWLGDETHAIYVKFVAYNGNYDYWVLNYYMLEMPTNGIIVPQHSLLVYKPLIFDQGEGSQLLIIDTVRLVLAIYIGVCQPMRHMRSHAEKQRKIKGQKERPKKFDPPWFKTNVVAGRNNKWQACFEGNNLIDMFGIGAMFVATYLLRFLVLYVLHEDTLIYRQSVANGYPRVERDADIYRATIIMDAVVFTFALWRWIGFMRLNRNVFLIFKTVSEALKMYARFGMVMIPVIICFVFVGHFAFRSYVASHRTFWSSFVAHMLRLIGDKDSARMATIIRPITVVHSVSIYIIIRLVLVNSWIASLVQTYQRVRVTSGYKPDDKNGPYRWNLQKYAEKFLWSGVSRWFVKRRRRTGDT